MDTDIETEVTTWMTLQLSQVCVSCIFFIVAVFGHHFSFGSALHQLTICHEYCRAKKFATVSRLQNVRIKHLLKNVVLEEEWL